MFMQCDQDVGILKIYSKPISNDTHIFSTFQEVTIGIPVAILVVICIIVIILIILRRYDTNFFWGHLYRYKQTICIILWRFRYQEYSASCNALVTIWSWIFSHLKIDFFFLSVVGSISIFYFYILIEGSFHLILEISSFKFSFLILFYWYK